MARVHAPARSTAARPNLLARRPSTTGASMGFACRQDSRAPRSGSGKLEEKNADASHPALAESHPTNETEAVPGDHPMRSNRRTFLALACLPVLAACATLPGSSARVPRHDAQTFYASTSFAGASFSHDGKTLL